MKLEGLFAILVAVLLLISSLISVKAQAPRDHEGHISWIPYWCCGDKDCREAIKVEEFQRGVRLTMALTDDPGASIQTFWIPWRRVKPSVDGKWYACIVPRYGDVEPRCIFGPLPGA